MWCVCVLSVVYLRVEMMGYYLGFGSDEFVFRLGSNYERHLMAA